MRTTQDIFNTVVTHLAKQGHRSVTSHGRCRYRGENGDKCAVGVFISDEDYDAETMEGQSCASPIVRTSLIEWSGFRAGLHFELARELQDAHDRYGKRGGAELCVRLYEIAAYYGLDAKVIKETRLKDTWLEGNP